MSQLKCFILLLLLLLTNVIANKDKTLGMSEANPAVNGFSYEHVCGQAKGYQKGITGAFNSKVQSIEGTYVDGISIALKSPRTHIWTYAVGYSTDVQSNKHNCPCAFHSGTGPPAFVRNDYYCDSGSKGAADKTHFYIYNPLWDGKECQKSAGCCASSGMPWFYRKLSLPLSKDFSISICKGGAHDDVDIGVEKLEIFVI